MYPYGILDERGLGVRKAGFVGENMFLVFSMLVGKHVCCISRYLRRKQNTSIVCPKLQECE